jgi:hypothetical protein
MGIATTILIRLGLINTFTIMYSTLRPDIVVREEKIISGEDAIKQSVWHLDSWPDSKMKAGEGGEGNEAFS